MTNLFNIEEIEIYSQQLPFIKRLSIYHDFQSQIKSVWLTGYLLVTWEWEDLHTFWHTLDFAFYQSGSYE